MIPLKVDGIIIRCLGAALFTECMAVLWLHINGRIIIIFYNLYYDKIRKVTIATNYFQRLCDIKITHSADVVLCRTM